MLQEKINPIETEVVRIFKKIFEEICSHVKAFVRIPPTLVYNISRQVKRAKTELVSKRQGPDPKKLLFIFNLRYAGILTNQRV